MQKLKQLIIFSVFPKFRYIHFELIFFPQVLNLNKTIYLYNEDDINIFNNRLKTLKKDLLN
jgi:hypothetical protein